MTAAVRAFVAVELPELVGPLPWPRPPERHLTLRFFAELPDDRVTGVERALREAGAAMAPFRLELRDGGFFPDPVHPRVAWVGAGAGRDALVELHRRVDRALAAAGLPGEGRPFVPHVTFLRLRGPRDVDRARPVVAALAGVSVGTTRVDEVVLFESRLSSAGAEHLPRARVRLGGSPGAPSGDEG